MTNLERYLSASIKSSKSVTKEFSTSFSLGIQCLGKEIRDPVYSIYGFVRVADEIVDTFFETNQEALLKDFESSTFSAIKEKFSTNVILHSFQSTVNKYNIDSHLIEAFFKSMKSDLNKNKHSQKSLDSYIYGSAEVVGLMCLKIFVNGDQKHYDNLIFSSRKLGSAFQKVNFFRDMNEDYNEKGRMYFPGLDFNKKINEEIKDKIEQEIKSEFDDAKKGIYKLPNSSRFGVLLACRYYEKLFKKLKSTPITKLLSRRIRVSNFEKFALIPSTFALSFVKNYSKKL
jgi:phytoene/squalene synthetase